MNINEKLMNTELNLLKNLDNMSQNILLMLITIIILFTINFIIMINNYNEIQTTK